MSRPQSSRSAERRAVSCVIVGLTLVLLAGFARADLTPHAGDVRPLRDLQGIPGVAPRPASAVPAREPASSMALAQGRVAVAPAVVEGPQAQKQRPYLNAIGAGAAWTHSGARPSVLVAIVDSGVDVTHPGLAGRLWENPHWDTSPDISTADDCPGDRYGCSFVSAETADRSCGYQSRGPSGAIADDNGHGTFVAGVVIAAADNSGPSGTGNVDVRILPVKVLDCTGEGRASQAAAGIRYAARAGARVIVVAFSGTLDSPALREAIADAQQSYGALIVAAAGNDGSAEAQFPSAYPGVLGVGGTGVVRGNGEVDYFQHAPFSNQSDAVSLLAPAVGIVGPVPRMLCGHRDWTCLAGEPYAYASGTSYATPLVAGAAALLFAYDSSLTPHGAIQLLIGTANPIEGSEAGQVDITAALAGAWSSHN